MLEGPFRLCDVRRLELSIMHSWRQSKGRSLLPMNKKRKGAEISPERPIRRMRRQRLSILLKEFGGPKALAAATGAVDTHLIAIDKGRRDIGDDLATKLEARAGKPFGWMDEESIILSPEALEIARGLDELMADPDRRRVALAHCQLAVFGPPPSSAQTSKAAVEQPQEDRPTSEPLRVR